jgi:hypothetical protein
MMRCQEHGKLGAQGRYKVDTVCTWMSVGKAVCDWPVEES